MSRLTHWRRGPSRTEEFTPFATNVLPALRIAVVGDVGRPGRHASAVAATVARAGAERPYDVLLLLGDNAYPKGDPALLPATVFEPYRPVLDAGAALLAILGNHDVMRGHGEEQLRLLGQSGRWWSRTIGAVLVIGLDSTRIDEPEQRAWLEHTLATTDARWKIVAIHHSPFSAGYQGSNRTVRNVFVPIFEQHGVQLVFSGHDHDYQRSRVLRGVTYVVSGGGSRARRTARASFTEVSFGRRHFVDVAVYDEHIELRAVTEEFRVGDHVRIA